MLEWYAEMIIRLSLTLIVTLLAIRPWTLFLAGRSCRTARHRSSSGRARCWLARRRSARTTASTRTCSSRTRSSSSPHSCTRRWRRATRASGARAWPPWTTPRRTPVRWLFSLHTLPPLNSHYRIRVHTVSLIQTVHNRIELIIGYK